MNIYHSSAGFYNYRDRFISIKGASTCNLNDISVDIPKRALSVITGAPASGKTALAVHTLCGEAAERLASTQRISERRKTLQKVRPEVKEIRGLIPAVALTQLVEALPENLPLARYLGLEQLLCNVVCQAGALRCREHASALEQGSVKDALGIVDKKYATNGAASAASSEEATLYVEAVVFFSQEIAQNQQNGRTEEERKPDFSLRDSIIESIIEYQRAGFRRFRVGGQLFSLPALKSLNTKELPEKEALSAAGGIDSSRELRARFLEYLQNTPLERLEFSVVVDRLQPVGDFQNRLSEALELAISLASGLALVREALPSRQKGSFPEAPVSTLAFSTKEAYCPQCKKLYPSLDKSVAQAYLQGVFDTESSRSGASNSQGVDIVIGEHSLGDLLSRPLNDFSAFLEQLQPPVEAQHLSLSKLLHLRIESLFQLGLGHIALNRRIRTLSSGERLKVALAAYFQQEPTQTLFVLDEPSRVLHPYDLALLLGVCKKLVDLGNTVVLVERQEEAIASADFVIELERVGEGARSEIVFKGSALEWKKERQVSANPDRPNKIPRNKNRNKKLREELIVSGWRDAEGKDSPFRMPLNALVSVVGRVGAGKSRFLKELVFEGFKKSRDGRPPLHNIQGFEALSRVLYYDTKPKRRRESTKARRFTKDVAWSVLGVESPIAQLYSELPEARRSGLSAQDFSLKYKEGCCESCAGRGVLSVDFDFVGREDELCDGCLGRRYTSKVQHVQYEGLSISEVLLLDIGQAIRLFRAHADIFSPLKDFEAFGLGRLRLGASCELEAQSVRERLSLAQALRAKRPEGLLLLLEQPLAGLAEEELILSISKMREFTQNGGTVAFSTHDPLAISLSNWVLAFSFEQELKYFGPPSDFALDNFLKLGKC